jgi:hypothetical protein
MKDLRLATISLCIILRDTELRFSFAATVVSLFVKTSHNFRENYPTEYIVYPIIMGYVLPLPYAPQCVAKNIAMKTKVPTIKYSRTVAKNNLPSILPWPKPSKM